MTFLELQTDFCAGGFKAMPNFVMSKVFILLKMWD